MVKVKADLHNHLRTSSNMEGLFNKVVDKTREKLGPGGIIAVANYNDERYESLVNQKGYERSYIGNATYIPEKNVLIYKAEEVPTKQGDLLVLGISENKHLKPGRSLEDSLKEAKDNNGINCGVHEFYFAGVGPYLKRHQHILEYFDGFEIHNGEAVIYIPRIAPANANKKAQEFYDNIIKPSWLQIGGFSSSDGHSIFEIGSSYTTIEEPPILFAEKLNESIRRSIKHHRDFSKDKRSNSYIGSLKHIAELGWFKVEQRIKSFKINLSSL